MLPTFTLPSSTVTFMAAAKDFTNSEILTSDMICLLQSKKIK
nr:MAG TPA: hypothetical protein [Caudoviricetes sp.]DAY39309.1 MAG TPA: hypothetical protein [Caudoviricetes sp.]